MTLQRTDDDRRRAAVQAGLDALLAGASMLDAIAASDAVMGGASGTVLSADVDARLPERV